MMLSFISKPSISTSSWFSVCSRSSWPPPRPAPRCRPTASISSMKTMHGRRLLRLLEEVAHAACADADEHLDEVGARDREERHARLAGDRAREQRLAGAGRPVEQDALRDPRAERLELLRVLEELLDLLQLLDRLLDAGDVLEADLRRVRRHPLRARLAEAHHLRAAALHLVHQEDPEAEQEHEREQAREDRPPRRRADALRVEGDALRRASPSRGSPRTARRRSGPSTCRPPVARQRRATACSGSTTTLSTSAGCVLDHRVDLRGRRRLRLRRRARPASATPARRGRR